MKKSKNSRKGKNTSKYSKRFSSKSSTIKVKPQTLKRKIDPPYPGRKKDSFGRILKKETRTNEAGDNK